MTSKGRIGIGAGVLTVAAAFIGTWEGVRLNAYPDRLANGVPTVCYGETRNVRLGDSCTLAECNIMLETSVRQFESGLERCMTPPEPLPADMKVALISWSYNVGLGAACRSTLVKHVNNGEYRAACEQLPRWNRAGGKIVRGLTNRRKAERDLCLRGVERV